MNVNHVVNCPQEIIYSIFQYLSPKELAVVSLVQKRFAEIAEDDLFWRSSCWQEYSVKIDTKNDFKKISTPLKRHQFCSKMVAWRQKCPERLGLDSFCQMSKKITQLGNQFLGEGNNPSELVFHEMLNSYLKNSCIRYYEDVMKIVDDFINFPPKSGIRKYQAGHGYLTVLRLKKTNCPNPFEFWIFAIISPKEWPTMSMYPFGQLDKKCYAELVSVTLAGGRPRYGTGNPVRIYDKNSYFPYEDVFHHIHSFFDSAFKRELKNPVGILKGFKLDGPYSH